MRVKNFAPLLLAASLSACVSAPPRVSAPETTCIPDPAHDLFHCNGISYPWKKPPITLEGKPERYVCTPVDEWEAFLNACRAD